MKEDYLWDKTGKDPEIERLENALEVFRYKETKPPALPENVLPFRREDKNVFSRKVFSIPMTIAASVAFLAVIAGLWLFASNRQEQIGNGVAQNNFQYGEELTWDIQQPPATTKSTTVTVAPNKVRRFSPKPKREEEIILTDEERYAYEQLMKALKITSEKLNYVKQKTQGEEETKSKAGSGSD